MTERTKYFDLYRIYHVNSGKTKGTVGVLIEENLDIALMTMERTEKIIPAGTYEVTFTKSRKFSERTPYKNYKGVPLINVPDRSGIRIHIGNFPFDLEGCIALGLSAASNSISFSTNGYISFMDYMKQNEYMPTILRIHDVKSLKRSL